MRFLQMRFSSQNILIAAELRVNILKLIVDYGYMNVIYHYHLNQSQMDPYGRIPKLPVQPLSQL